MENEQARIKLAEAMGWERGEVILTSKKTPIWGRKGDYRYEYNLPDPFTDANGDYAVLEWMRNEVSAKDPRLWCDYIVEVENASWVYCAGDYARAACKVLGIDYDAAH